MAEESIPEIDKLAIQIEVADAQLKIYKNKKEEASIALLRALNERGLSHYKGNGRVVSVMTKSDSISIKKVQKLSYHDY